MRTAVAAKMDITFNGVYFNIIALIPDLCMLCVSFQISIVVNILMTILLA